MKILVAGENTELAQRILRFGARDGLTAVKVAALALDERNGAPSDWFVADTCGALPGVRWTHGAMHVDTDSLQVAVNRVLCIAYQDVAPKSLLCNMSGVTAEMPEGDAQFSPSGVLYPAMICFEVYRRGAGWKLRAVGQGYAGGLAELLDSHGVPAPPVSGLDVGTASVPPLGDADPLERIWMVFEDAARSAAAFLSARDYAASRLDNELSAAISDPATRNTAAAEQASALARQRNDDLVARARADYARDSAQLSAELRVLDAELPPPLASWSSPAWSGSPSTANGIKLGDVSMPEAGLLSLPFCVPAPLLRPIWVDTLEPAAALPVVAALILRLLAATPSPAPTLDVVDLAGALNPLTQALSAWMPRPAVRDAATISARLGQLAEAADFAELSAQVNNTPATAGVIVLSDVGYGMDTDGLGHLVVLASKAAAANLSIVLIGDGAAASTHRLLDELRAVCQYVPAVPGGHTVRDPFARNEWQFIADALPLGATPLAQVITGLSALERRA